MALNLVKYLEKHPLSELVSQAEQEGVFNEFKEPFVAYAESDESLDNVSSWDLDEYYFKKGDIEVDADYYLAHPTEAFKPFVESMASYQDWYSDSNGHLDAAKEKFFDWFDKNHPEGVEMFFGQVGTIKELNHLMTPMVNTPLDDLDWELIDHGKINMEIVPDVEALIRHTDGHQIVKMVNFASGGELIARVAQDSKAFLDSHKQEIFESLRTYMKNSGIELSEWQNLGHDLENLLTTNKAFNKNGTYMSVNSLLSDERKRIPGLQRFGAAATDPSISTFATQLEVWPVDADAIKHRLTEKNMDNYISLINDWSSNDLQIKAEPYAAGMAMVDPWTMDGEITLNDYFSKQPEVAQEFKEFVESGKDFVQAKTNDEMER